MLRIAIYVICIPLCLQLGAIYKTAVRIVINAEDSADLDAYIAQVLPVYLL